MKHIPATDAKAHLAELLRAVERGESFSITRHGKAIAHLVPAAAGEDRARREALALPRTAAELGQGGRQPRGDRRLEARGASRVTPIVVDASVAACWLFDDESDARADAALAALELACRRRAVLASLDDRLLRAARAEGVVRDPSGP